MFLNPGFLANYGSFALKFDKSNQLIESARKVSPNGCHSWGVRIFPLVGRFEGKPELPEVEYPRFMSRALGSHLYDVDGNDFIDYYMGLGPVILGHSDRKVADAVKVQMEKGVLFGLNHESEIELCELFIEHVPSAEMVSIVTTGSDATAAALRISRAYSRKQKVVKFSGHYHSWHDWNKFDSYLYGHLEESGYARSVADDVIVLPWNQPHVAEKVLKSRSSEIAAVICETVLGNGGCIMPAPGFLGTLREVTEEKDIVLIFDEVVTGFRVGIGGAQKLLGVTPDLSTFAKAMANGFPIGAVVGRKEIMKTRAFVGGTYNSSPLCTAAAISTIKQLEDETRWSSMFRKGERLMMGIQEAANEAGLKCHVQGLPSLFSIIFGLGEAATHPEQFSEIPVHPDLRRCASFYQGMVNRGVFNAPARSTRWCLSMSHSDEDIENTIVAARESMKEAAKIA